MTAEEACTIVSTPLLPTPDGILTQKGDQILPKKRKKLFTLPPHKRTRTSDVLAELSVLAKTPDITLRQFTDRLGDRTFGLLLVMFSLLNAIPFISTFSGGIIASLGLQVMLGHRKAWLPAVILDRPLPHNRVVGAFERFIPIVKKMEVLIKPRFHFAEAPLIDRLNGLIIVILGVFIALPIPLANLGPALIVTVMGLGMLERDGLLRMTAAMLGLLIITLSGLLVL